MKIYNKFNKNDKNKRKREIYKDREKKQRKDEMNMKFLRMCSKKMKQYAKTAEENLLKNRIKKQKITCLTCK